jgi:hypothetical protein
MMLAFRVGLRSPVVSFMNVDLPQPDGPTMAMNSPSLTLRSIASTAKWFCAANSALYASQTSLKSTKG